MDKKMQELANNFAKITAPQSRALNDRADELLISVAVLGLVATVADGKADHREIDCITRSFRKQFALSRRHSLKLIGAALKRIRQATEGNIIDCSCDTLNEHLEVGQKEKLFECLADVLISDGIVHEGEEDFLDYVAYRLGITRALEKRYLLM
jgi:uncharacterized tellurite resistance protein B-like protein